MIFDDRLETVLRNKPATSEAGYIQYLQLIDLLGRRAESPPIPDEALDRLAELEEMLPLEQRGLLLQSSAPLLRHAELVLRLASQPAPVADAAIAAARLSDANWAALIPELTVHARACLRRRNDLGPLAQETLARLSADDLAAEAADEGLEDRECTLPSPGEGAAPASIPNAEGIAAIVRRIEALRRSRGAEASAEEASAPASGVRASERLRRVAEVAFACDAAGTMIEANHDCAPMLVGLTLGQRGAAAPARCDPGTIAAMAARCPIVRGRLYVDGARRVAGAWRIDAAPRFDPTSGSFLGYAGLLRRPAASEAHGAPAFDGERVQMLELLHELRTPLNAIVGFAEFIHQQLLGPVPYRHVGHAANVHADAAYILGALHEVGQVLAGNADAGSRDATTDVASLAGELVGRLEHELAAKQVSFDVELTEPTWAALDEESAGRLLWRLVTTLATAAKEGERLRLASHVEDKAAVLTASLPEHWTGCDAASLLSDSFALPLAAAEAKGLGGRLRLGEDRIVLRLPRPAMAQSSPENAGSDALELSATLAE